MAKDKRAARKTGWAHTKWYPTKRHPAYYKREEKDAFVNGRIAADDLSHKFVPDYLARGGQPHRRRSWTQKKKK